MKNKAKTYFLIVAALGIWGTIIFKIVKGISPDEINVVKPSDPDMTFNPKANTKTDTFSIQNLKRDPFLGTLSQKKNTSKISISVNKDVENSPLMTYNGLVKKQSTSEHVFVVNVNNNQYLLKRGQIADSVKLIKGNDNEITVLYRNKSKIIKRQ